MKKRLEYIDIAKGLGIILVVLSHTDHSELMYYTSAFFVPIFFFCSGYTSSKKEISLATCFRRQTKKLIKPYLFFSILLLLYFHDFSIRAIAGIFYSRYCLYPFGTTPDICHLMIVGNYPMWFLTCMIVAYLLYDLLIYFPKYQYWLIFLYLIITFGMSNLPILLPWSIDTAPLMAVIMFSGALTKQFIPEFSSNKKQYIIIIVAFFIYLLLLPFCHNINISVRMFGSSIVTYLLAAIAGCILLTWLAQLLQGSIIGKGLKQVGIHSLTIFCLEIPFVLLSKQISILIPADLSLLQMEILTSVIQLIIALLGGYLLSVFICNNPIISKFLF